MAASKAISFSIILLALLQAGDASCPCGDEALCKSIAIPPAKQEIFAFVTGQSWKHFLEYSPAVTTVALFGTPTPDLVCAAHKKGARVVLGTSFKNFANATARAEYVSTTVAKMTTLGIDGFNIDIEGNTAHKDELTALIQELSTSARKANPHAQITFDLAIGPDGQTGGYDHKSLAKYLDFIVPMAYDECWGASQARANSPIAALAGGVQQYKDLGVPADKLVIGLPWYGWDFPCDSATSYGDCKITVPQGKPWYGYATQISYSAANITAEHGSQEDASSVTMITEYFENVNGTEKRHQQWFDNPQTLTAKYQELSRLGCRGVAFWTADEVDYTTSQGEDMWSALSAFGDTPADLIV